MLKKRRNSQSGFSLIELMIAMVIGFIIVGGALYLGTASMKASRDNIRMSFLNQELRNVLNLVSRDLKRASYWGGTLDLVRVNSVATLTFSAVTGTSVSVTQTYDTADVAEDVVDRLGNASVGSTLVYLQGGLPYRATITDYDEDTNTYTVDLLETFPNTVLAANGGAADGTWSIIGPAPSINLTGTTCVVFGYDMNGNGVVTTSSGGDERVGYRLNSGAVEIRQGGAGCGDGGWQNVTDEDAVLITNFTITDHLVPAVAGSALSVRVREYTIQIAGELTADSNVKRAVRETVRVRNNEVFDPVI